MEKKFENVDIIYISTIVWKRISMLHNIQFFVLFVQSIVFFRCNLTVEPLDIFLIFLLSDKWSVGIGVKMFMKFIYLSAVILISLDRAEGE